MIELGKTQILTVVKQTDFGVYLNDSTGKETDKILLPKKQIPEDISLHDPISVFVYKDSEDRLIATTMTPLLELKGLAKLQVVDVNPIGAFLNWGLAKDLLLPYKEQTVKVRPGDCPLVSLYIDKSDRLCATMKVYEYLHLNSPYQKDDLVTGTVYDTSDDFGMFVAVDNLYSALIPRKELYRPLSIGDEVNARVALRKEDGKLDLSLREKIPAQMDADASIIYQKLLDNENSLPFHDKSDPDDIKKYFCMSKNSFKRAVGRLLKEGKIKITNSGIQKIDE